MERDLHYYEIIYSSIQAIEGYLSNVDENIFLENDILRHAVLMRLIVIGEYGAKISDESKNEFKEIEWQILKAARNFYIHVYDKVNWIYIWETVKTDLPDLKQKIQNIINQLDKKS